MKTLHILNGDATLHQFLGEDKLPGDTLVWREVLSEGPVSASITYQEFFAIRSKWIAGAFSSNESDYKQKVIDEFKKLESAGNYDVIVLCFEFDLHCQINLLFLLYFFSKSNLTSTKLWLICPASHPNHPDFRGIGQLSHQDLIGLYPSRISLNESTLAFATKAWQAYCTADKSVINALLEESFEQLALLKPALQAHLERLPDSDESTSHFEQKLINIVNAGTTDHKAIYAEFWKQNPIYGMGDAEIDMYIDKLIKQRHINNQLT